MCVPLPEPKRDTAKQLKFATNPLTTEANCIIMY